MSLSTKCYEHVPKNPVDNRLWRAMLYARAREDRSIREGMRELARHDLLFFVNAFVWQMNPKRLGEEVGPFVSWDFQDAAFLSILGCIEEQKDLCILKSKEMGASWICLIVMFWRWLFKSWQKFHCISRNQPLADSSDSDSLFWKLRFMLRYQPDFILPKGFQLSRHSKENYILNPENGSTMTAEASTGKAGIGGRATAMFIDEFSRLPDAYSVLHHTSDTADCRIFNFTFTGVDNAAFELSRRPDIRKLQLHWSQHPLKNQGMYRVVNGQADPVDPSYVYAADYKFVLDGSPTGGPYPGLRSPWYDEACVRKGSSRAVAMDLDIDPQGSQSQFFNAVIIRQLQESCCDPYWEGDIEYDADGRILALKERKGGPLKLWLRLDRGKPPLGVYGFGADVSNGQGATPSCLAGTNSETGEKVLEYRDPLIQPEHFAALTVGLCRLFGEARLAWECPGPGLNFGKRVIELGYRNIHYRTREQKVYSTGPADTPGWYATPQSKLLLLGQYKEALEQNQFLNRSKGALEECLSFEYLRNGYVEHGGIEGGDDPSGARINHGDQTIADALSWMVSRPSWEGRKKREQEKPAAPWATLSLDYRRQLWVQEKSRADEDEWY
jgi:hypothetical protein